MNMIQSATEQTTPSQCYRIILSDGTIVFVPNDPLNRDYINLQKWVAAGGTIASVE